MNEPRVTVASAIADAKGRQVARLDAELMLGRLLERPRTWLIAHDDAVLDAERLGAWLSWLKRRAAGEPLAYLLGVKEFSGLMLAVDARVLVPRPETELLVDWSGELMRCQLPGTSVLDLGTGSGAIALALKAAHPGLRLTATDASDAALDVARRNAASLALAIEFVVSSWWDALHGRRFDLIVSNPPYVADDDPALVALRHEPLAALTPGGDGLSALTEIIAGAAPHLRPGSWLLLEHGFDQGAAVRDMLVVAGFDQVETRRDLAGHERASGGRFDAPVSPPVTSITP